LLKTNRGKDKKKFIALRGNKNSFIKSLSPSARGCKYQNQLR
jgi:hypothetical protein